MGTRDQHVHNDEHATLSEHESFDINQSHHVGKSKYLAPILFTRVQPFESMPKDWRLGDYWLHLV